MNVCINIIYIDNNLLFTVLNVENIVYCLTEDEYTIHNYEEPKLSLDHEETVSSESHLHYFYTVTIKRNYT